MKVAKCIRAQKKARKEDEDDTAAVTQPQENKAEVQEIQTDEASDIAKLPEVQDAQESAFEGSSAVRTEASSAKMIKPQLKMIEGKYRSMLMLHFLNMSHRRVRRYCWL